MGNEAKHSPEPWRHEVFNAQRPGLGWDVYGTDGARVASEMDSEDDARRIVACVNACAGIPTEALEAGALWDALEWLDAWESTDPDGAPNGVVDTLRALGRLP